MYHLSTGRRSTPLKIASALVLSLCLFGAGCAGSSSDADDASSSEAAQASASENAAASSEASLDSADADASTEEASAEGGAVETHTVQTDLGAVEIPVDPQRILALDEYAAMNMLVLGVTPAEVVGAYGSHVSQELLTGNGVAISETADEMLVNFELIAALAPDVIVMTAESAFLGHYDQLSEIAPTVTLLYSAPWREVITKTGETFMREEEAVQAIAAVEAQLAEVAAKVEASDVETLSILGETYGITFGVSSTAALSGVIEELGLGRPADQLDAEPMAGFESVAPISTELLEGHDADLIAVLSGDYYDENVLLEAPTFKDLPAVKDGRSVVVDGDMWFGTHPFAVYWIAEDIANLVEGNGQDGVGVLEDTQERWAAFEELLG